jgi:hypothetical protein
MSSPSRCVGSTTASFIARVTRPRGGARTTLILFQSRSGSGSTRGSMARPPRSMEASSLDLQPRRKRPSKGQPPRPLIQASMRGVPPAKLSMAAQANDLVFRQVEANQGNSSTGPNTEAGKRRSRRNAVRHGLTAETVVVALEDIKDPRASKPAVIADYDARSRRALAGALACIGVMLANATSTEMITIPRSKALT